MSAPKRSTTSPKANAHHNRYRLTAVLALLTFTMVFIISTNAMQVSPEYNVLVYQGQWLDTDIGPSDQIDSTEVHHHKIKKGESLSGVMQQFGVLSEFKHLLTLDKKSLKDLNRLRENRPITLTIDDDKLMKLVYKPSETKHLIVTRNEEGKFAFEKRLLEIDTTQAYASGTIEDSLYIAGKKAGLSDKIIIDMANILAWDVDFVYDIREGDHFTVIYEENFVGSKKIGDGKIVGLHFSNNGKHYDILRYTDINKRSDYYNLQGASVRKAFLRSPLDFAYVSSHFNLKRKHPILHKVRAHTGVDYAANTGTPIKAAGDGRIIFRGTKGGYGKTVILKHGGTYQTLYAHMSRYAKGQKLGSLVRQGQIIGYVGSTGLSTGPHLHYEFHVRGIAKDPLKVKLPNSKPLAKKEMARFLSTTRKTVSQLQLLKKAYLAAHTES